MTHAYYTRYIISVDMILHLGGYMLFTPSAGLLDAVVLSVVSLEETYGYKITQDVQNVIPVSESTLYPVLRRLLKDGLLETRDEAVSGRNRRYYKITSNGMIRLDEYRREWIDTRKIIDSTLMGGSHDQ